MIQSYLMGRRSFWYNLSKAEENNISAENIIEMLNAHNNSPFEERGESIDTCYLFDHCYEDESTTKWLYFSSGGGDWVTEEYGFYPQADMDRLESAGKIWKLAVTKNKIQPDKKCP